MRIAVLNDIHGNLPALEAVFEDVHRSDVDRIVVGGDILPGPMSHQVLDRLQSERVTVEFIYGNGEVAVLDQVAGRAPKVPEAYAPSIRWNAGQLNAAQRTLIASWPMTLRLNVPAFGDVLFCHATPRDENEIFTRLTAEDRLTTIFDPVNAALVVCGHTHMQFDRMVGKTRVVNAGSVGMPFGRAGADWLLLGPDIELRHTDYDLADAAERIRRSGYPAADEFVTKYLLDPPSAEEMLKAYNRLAPTA